MSVFFGMAFLVFTISAIQAMLKKDMNFILFIALAVASFFAALNTY